MKKPSRQGSRTAVASDRTSTAADLTGHQSGSGPPGCLFTSTAWCDNFLFLDVWQMISYTYISQQSASHITPHFINYYLIQVFPVATFSQRSQTRWNQWKDLSLGPWAQVHSVFCKLCLWLLPGRFPLERVSVSKLYVSWSRRRAFAAPVWSSSFGKNCRWIVMLEIKPEMTGKHLAFFVLGILRTWCTKQLPPPGKANI